MSCEHFLRGVLYYVFNNTDEFYHRGKEVLRCLFLGGSWLHIQNIKTITRNAGFIVPGELDPADPWQNRWESDNPEPFR